MIKVKYEPKDLRYIMAEQCYFCGLFTRYWHEKTNTPVCKECAAIHDSKEITKWEEEEK